MPSPETIAENISRIRRQIADYAAKYARNASNVSLLAVSKTKPVADIQAAFEAGQRCFGESYLQEALDKIAALQQLPIEWHFIGHIQSNKTLDIAHHFAWVHSVDRLKIARRLSEQRPTDLPPLNVCLQINISAEASKSGISLQQLDELAIQVAELPAIRLRGLMAIPARCDSFSEQRALFHQLNDALQGLNAQGLQLDTLSMGMSGDMEAAIAEGATIVRIGTAIFGPRST